jgi:hypothetical protein
MTNVPQAPEARNVRWHDALLRGIYVIRVPIAIGVLSILVLTLVDQVREVHRVLTQERAADAWHLHWLLALTSLVALSIVLWQMARQHAEDSEYGDDHPPSEGTAPDPLYGWLLRWGPRFVATLPLLGAAAGIWLSRLPNFDMTNAPPALVGPLKVIAALQTHFLTGALICVALALLVFIGACMFERKLAPVGSGRSRKVALFNNWLLFPLVILASIILLVRDPVHLPQTFGSIPIFALWMVNLAVLTALFSRYRRRFGVPALATVVVLLLVFEVFGLADNHEFRHQDSSVQRPSIESAFRSWLAARKDAQAYRNANKPYPVYIVAAEGGGMYAAYQTAKFLARMQDLCPTFAQHLFSISSVSGGSLGAGVFAALAKSFASNIEDKPCLDKLDRAGAFEARADKILSRDLLAPVVWGGLFPDFLQRFLPHPIPAFDRARALEYAFEDAWYHGAGHSENPMKEAMFALCGSNDPACTTSATPTLAFNVTNVETGMQMVLSALDFTSIGPPWSASAKVFDFFATGIDPVDVPLSTAIGLSARFPWISPAGWYTFTDPSDKAQGGKDRKRRMSFVDGGYVDNSGAATASKLAQSLAEFVAKTPPPVDIELKLIMISAAWIPFDRFWMDEPTNKAQSEILSPLVAALAAWQGRGYTMQYDLAADPKPGFKILEAGVYYNFLPLPLGWQLSSVSRGYIDLFKGHPEKCDQSQLDRSLESHALLANSYINRADCVAAEIVHDLTPTAARIMMRSITPAQ